MSISYFDEFLPTDKGYILNNIRMKRFRDKYLITTDHGAWVALDKKEYDDVLRYNLSDDLFLILEKKGIIITKRNMSIIEDYLQKRYSFLFGGVGLHIVVPTLRCNHKCIYCHSKARSCTDKNFDMDENMANKMLCFIFQSPAKKITIEFQGGEPLLNFDLIKFIVLEAKNKNKRYQKQIKFALVTNMTLMNHDIIEFLDKEGVTITTSLDGPKSVHDANRVYEGGNGSYDDVINQIKKSEKEYNRKVGALMVTTKKSLSFPKEIVDEYLKWDFSDIQLKYIDKLGFADEQWKECGYTIDEFIEFWTKCMDYMIELNLQGKLIRPRFSGLILTKVLTDREPGFLDFRSPCGIGCGQLAYDYNGDIYCCDEGRVDPVFKLGNVTTDTYSDVVLSDNAKGLLSSSINDVALCDACVYKPYCGLCPVISYAEHGSIIPQLAKSAKCKFYKKKFDYIFEKLLFDKRVLPIFEKWKFK